MRKQGDNSSEASETTNVEEKPGKAARFFGFLRRFIAGVAILAGGIMLAASYWHKPLEICRSVAGGNNFTTTSLCNPWTAVDILPFLLVAAAFMLPDLTEFNVFNVISLKREVKEQKKEIEEVEKKRSALEESVNLRMNSLQANMQSVTSNTYLYPPTPASKLPEELDEKVQKSKEEKFTRPVEHAIDKDAALLQATLLREWEKISSYLQESGVFPTRNGKVIEADQTNRTARLFAQLFRDEIATIQSVRNSIAHAMHVAPEDLKGAVEAAVKLNEIIKRPSSYS
ncbi:hypothetical protein ACIGNX_05360 [Actinosynnema sp. NPDC053489]|uniref:hypothetical protein n=1 Tax=Actinosynnema sp. NPDC053489 TaxID=3363916 RepID=UPI0037CC0B6F